MQFDAADGTHACFLRSKDEARRADIHRCFYVGVLGHQDAALLAVKSFPTPTRDSRAASWLSADKTRPPQKPFLFDPLLLLF